jgi:hypothetical protein
LAATQQVELMLVLLAGSTCIICWGNKKSQDAGTAAKASAESALTQ